MNSRRRSEPTPEALRNGRRTLVIFGVFVAVLLALNFFITDFADGNTWAIMATTGVAFVGDCIAYLGQPSLTRYRLGLVVTTIGIVAGFAILITNPF